MGYSPGLPKMGPQKILWACSCSTIMDIQLKINDFNNIYLKVLSYKWFEIIVCDNHVIEFGTNNTQNTVLFRFILQLQIRGLITQKINLKLQSFNSYIHISILSFIDIYKMCNIIKIVWNRVCYLLVSCYTYCTIFLLIYTQFFFI